MWMNSNQGLEGVVLLSQGLLRIIGVTPSLSFILFLILSVFQNEHPDELLQSNDPQGIYGYLANKIGLKMIRSVPEWHCKDDFNGIQDVFILKSTSTEPLKPEEMHEQNVFRQILTIVVALFHAAGVSYATEIEPELDLPNYTADDETEEHALWASQWIDAVLESGCDIEFTHNVYSRGQTQTFGLAVLSRGSEEGPAAFFTLTQNPSFAGDVRDGWRVSIRSGELISG